MPGESARAAPRQRSTRAGSTAATLPRAPPGATLPRSPFGRPNGQALLHDPARESAARLVVGQREDGARVAFAHVPAGEHPEHLLRKLEQPQAVRDGGLRAPDALGHVTERELELVDERRVRARFLDG